MVSQVKVYRLTWKMTEVVVSVSMCADIGLPSLGFTSVDPLEFKEDYRP